MIPIVRYTATFKKLVLDQADSDKESWQVVDGLVGIGVDIQPANADLSLLSAGMGQKTHTMFTNITASGVQEGWRVTISGLYDGKVNREMTVLGAQDWGQGPLPHLQFTLGELDD